MEQQLPLYENHRKVGTLLRQEEGLHELFTADCPGGEGMRKVWLRSGEGGRLLLGTLAPERGGWRVRRRIARTELRRQGLGEELWGEIRPAGWMPRQEQPPPVIARDPVIARSLRRWNGGQWRRQGRLWRLSFPWQVGQEMPMETLFCFARTEGGEVVFLLDDNGIPVLP